jgi:hypothetical protein
VLTRLMSSVLFQVNARVGMSFGAGVVLLAGLVLVACWLPAREPLGSIRWSRCATNKRRAARFAEIKARKASRPDAGLECANEPSRSRRRSKFLNPDGVSWLP